MKKRFAAILCLLVLTAFAGCSRKAPNPEPVTITVWTYYNGDQLNAFNAQVDLFNKTVGMEQGITVVSSSYGSVGDLESSVLDAANGKVGSPEVPNIFGAYVDTAYTIDKMGLVADLSPYFTEEELNAYVDSYIEEGHFTGKEIKVFPVAKSVEIFLLNKTDWDTFAAATGASYQDFATIEDLTKTAQAYYEWTDSLTPQPNDGKAFFGRDAMANYFLVGAMQQGVEIFQVIDGKMTLNFDRTAVRRLWDNYYIPYIKGYFASSGRFRSDDIKTGNILSFVGSSSGATFFPDQVILSDSESHSIEMAVFPAPQFQGSRRYAVQQGAGLVVTNRSPREVEASVAFLKWFTQQEQNISFSVGSGYLPVLKSSNTMDAIHDNLSEISPIIEQILTVGVQTVQDNTLYTPRPFPNGGKARQILEYSMGDLAAADRQTVLSRLDSGMSLEDATQDFTGDAYFDRWYTKTLEQLRAFDTSF